MERAKRPKPVYICILSITVLLIFLCSSLSSKHRNLLFSTHEFIILAKSRRMAVFLMSNVIIITIFLGSYKPSAEDFDGFFQPSRVIDEMDYAKENRIVERFDSYDVEEDYFDDEYHGYDGYEEDNDDDIGEEDISSEDETDVYLERKIEEFIAKVHEKWREELHADPMPKLLCIAAAATE